MSHDPIRFMSALSSKLATKSRHVCFLFGAGTSRAAGLPDVATLTSKLIEEAAPPDGEILHEVFAAGGLEAGLSRLRALRAVLREGQSLDGLDAEEAGRLDALVCRGIINALQLDAADLVPDRLREPQGPVGSGRDR